MAQLSDSAIMGSAFIKLLAKYGSEAPEHVGAYVKSMKDAIKSKPKKALPFNRSIVTTFVSVDGSA